MKKNLFIFLIIISTLPAIFSLFHPGFFQSDDGEWMIVRFSAFHQALRDGEFPVRWLGRLNYGYGYPVANFLYPGFMYFGEIPKVLGFGFVNSIKIIFGLSMVSSAIFTYLWLKKVFREFPAFFGALFYLYTPYHLYDLYKRGSVGEVLALTIVPFIFWSIERKSLFWISMGVASLILSHNTLALLFLPIIIIYGFLRKPSTISHQLSTIIFGLALSAFFWIPAIFDLQFTRFSQTSVSNWQDYFVNLSLIGWGTLVIFIIFLIKYFRFNDLNHFSKIALMFFLLGVGGIFFSLSSSSFFWRVLPVNFIQFPFRFLSIVILSTTFLSAFVFERLNKKKKIILSVILLPLLLISAIPYAKPATLFDKGEEFYTTNEDSTTVQNEYMPKWVKVVQGKRALAKAEIIRGKGTLTNIIYKNNKVNFTSQMINGGIIRVNTVYFPGWEALVDGDKIAILYDNGKGVMDIPVDKGTHTIKLIFVETPIRLAADGVSLVSFIILLGIKFKERMREV